MERHLAFWEDKKKQDSLYDDVYYLVLTKCHLTCWKASN